MHCDIKDVLMHWAINNDINALRHQQCINALGHQQCINALRHKQCINAPHI